MSYDLQHLFWMQTQLTIVGPESEFVLPLLLTSDKGLGDLIPSLQIQSALCFGAADPQPIYESNIEKRLVNWTNDEGLIDRVFSLERHLERTNHITSQNTDWILPIISKLEEQIAK